MATAKASLIRLPASLYGRVAKDARVPLVGHFDGRLRLWRERGYHGGTVRTARWYKADARRGGH